MQGIKKRLVFNYGIILFLAVFILELIFIVSVHQYYYGSVEQTLKSRVNISAEFYNQYLSYHSLRDKGRYIFENTSAEEKAAVEVIDLHGKVIANSSGIISDNKIIAPDIEKAIEGKTGIWVGKNNITGEKIMAVSNPLRYNNKDISGVLRYSTSLQAVDEQIMRLIVIAVLLGLLVIVLALVFSLLLARSIINPIHELTGTAKKMAEGDFSVKAVKRNDDEIGNLAETFNYMADEIAQSEKVKNDFISSISHELRTPLTSIKGWSETILAGNMEDKEETRQGLKIITRETDRLTGLVEELLDFSRFESGRAKLHKQEFDINKLAEEVYQQFRLRALKTNIQLNIELAAGISKIQGDRNRLKQVIINLLDNALKFTPESGKITIRTSFTIEKVQIEVIDNGCGIAEKDIPRVTEKFYQGEGAVSGSGLGLSICKEIIKLHNGSMHISSNLRKGTIVTITLPVK